MTTPHAQGRISLPGAGAEYVIGRDHVARPALALAGASAPLACDIETEGLGAAAMAIKAVTLASGTLAVVCDPRDPAQAVLIGKALAAARTLVFHNSPFDVPILIRSGLMTMASTAKVIDTLIYARLAEPDERTAKSLLACSARYLGTDPADYMAAAFRALGMAKKDGFKQFDLDRGIYAMGAAIDGITTARILPLVRLAARLRLTTGHPFSDNGVTGAEAEVLLEREQHINRLFLRRSAKGFRVDLGFLDRYEASVMAARYTDALVLAEQGIREGVSADVAKWLDNQGLLPARYPRTAKTRAPSGTAAALGTLKHPVAEAFLRVKQVDKIRADYLGKVRDSADEQERIHPSVTILGAATGRMSMSGPPLQQFPAEARGIILAEQGDSLVSIDWSAIEPVVAANIAGDTAVLQGYEDGTSDLYTQIAIIAGITRKRAKVVVLALMYGEGMAALAADLGCSTDDAYDLRRAVFRAMPRVAGLMRKLRDIAEQHRMIFTLSGRILPIPMGRGFDGGPPRVQSYKCVNYFVQGSAYDVLAEALVRIEDAGLGDAVYLAMHDELVVSVSAAADIRKIMQTPPERLCQLAGRVPVLHTDSAELGSRWGE